MTPFRSIPRPAAAVDGWIDALAPGDVILHARGGRSDEQRSYRFRAPERELLLLEPAALPDFLADLDAAIASGRAVAGFLAYEAGAALVDLPPLPAPPYPLAWFGVYGEGEEVAEPAPIAVAAGTLGAARLRLSAAEFAERVAAVRRFLAAGDAYQVNLTTAFELSVGDVRAAYRALSTAQPVAFGALIDGGGVQIASLSPESFVRCVGGPASLRLAARPMKGTAPRAADPEADRAVAERLAADPKARAENVMIVDLLRNDLGRLAFPGSVRVTELFTPERYPTLWQLTSTVVAEAPRDTPLSRLLRALFPCGSITGAPKRRAMELIASLEDEPRGVYTGAIGFALPDPRGRLQRAAFSVAIRTLVVRGDRGRLGVGAGLLVDADAAAEFAEVELKGRFLAAPATPAPLLETMRAVGTTLPRWSLHRERLQASAAAFGWTFDPERLLASIMAELAAANALAAAALPRPVWRVRVVVDRAAATVQVTRHEDEVGPARVALSAVPIRADDPARRHKSLDRALYDAASAWARERGLADVIFCNDHGRVAEGAISNLFVEGPDGRWRTPPLRDGALPGVLRAALLARGAAVESALSLAELRAGRVLIGNALRGLRRLEWSDDVFVP